MWRVQICGSVDAAMRLSVFWRLTSGATKRSSRSHVSRETASPISEIARARSSVRAAVSALSEGPGAKARALRCGGAGALSRAGAAKMRHQKRESCRRHAVNASRLTDGAGPNRRKLLAHLHGERRHRRVVERLRELQPFVAPIGRHIGGLALQIDRVLGIDLA